MGNSEPIKIKLVTVFLILTMIIIIIMSGFIYRIITEKKKADEKINILNKNISNLENLINDTFLYNTNQNSSSEEKSYQ